MHSRSAARHKALLLNPEQMGRADRASSVPVATLMQAAGRAVARAARRFGRCRCLVLCGPGNNGGDGRVAARLLAQEGWPVQVVGLDDPRFDPAEAARADLVIDAVFGAGMRGLLPERVADVLQAARRVLAVDVPSGLDGATGQPRGRVRAADLTVTFARLKPGHLLLPGRALCGPTLLADIGLPASALDAAAARTWRNGPALWSLREPSAADHKYMRGHVTVLGGAEMTGAARLAAAGARRGGAGLVTIAAQGRGDVYRAGEPGVIVTEQAVAELLEDARRHVWVCGPGLGLAAARTALPVLLAVGRQVVADADALSAFAGEADALRGCAVLTPHEGEFARLFGPVGDDKLEATRAAAARLGAVVLLKGGDTVVAAPDGRAVINDTAPPFLATAGSGDVLAGLIGALLAQGMPAWEAACAGAWLHGRAGALAGPGLLAEDLADLLPAARREATAALFPDCAILRTVTPEPL
ncbi:MAG: bifunctional ADP-dependent NAD(P)H-hydrate dehydratase/NAD(P)H-hydrate epimerase [Acetobacteraceae bacterium]